MNPVVAEIEKRWTQRQVPMTKDTNGQVWVHGDYFDEALHDVAALAAEVDKSSKAKSNAERKARKAKKKIQGSLGDTPVKGVAEQGLYRSEGPNAHSVPVKVVRQSRSVSRPLDSADEAGHRDAVGQTNGSRDIADANGPNRDGGRQSSHPTTTADRGADS